VQLSLARVRRIDTTAAAVRYIESAAGVERDIAEGLRIAIAEFHSREHSAAVRIDL
jgi:hypothetical protein